MQTLPVDSHLESICNAVAESAISIVDAPPGSGKTTRVAPALLQMLEQRGDVRKIYLLQPRRLAAKSVAERIAFEQRSELGKKVGYQVRFENQSSSSTQLIVATEGILLRRLQSDPAIEDVSIVLLDEFHERSLDADLLLGMLRRVQQTLREDLKIVIMSATIDLDTIRKSLGDIPVSHVATRNFPVKTLFRPLNPKDRIVDHLVRTVAESVDQYSGDVLAFLPGAGEIHRAFDELSRTPLTRDFDLCKLYGSMPLDEQSKAIQSNGRRKIVLATNVAETSLTIEGVRLVIDSGLARVMRFSPDVGLDRLCLENISQASATQRAGRAGRVAPGVCIRLWSEASDRARAPYLEPEIRRLDLASAALQLYAWGEGNTDDFPWLESPRPESWSAAEQLLTHLGAIDEGRITDLGRRMCRIPVHPRLARMVIDAAGKGCLSRVALVAAMLSEREPFDRREQRDRPASLNARSAPRWDSDCLERLIAIENFLSHRQTHSFFGEIHVGAVRSIVASAEQIVDQARNALQLRNGEGDEHHLDRELLMQSLLTGFPDRLARKRAPQKPNGLMVGGKGVALSPQSGVQDAEFFLCVDIDGGRGADAQVRQASKVEVDWILDGLKTSEELFFHPTQKQVVARRQTKWIDLVLQETPTTISDNAKAREVLFQAVKQNWDATFPTDQPALLSFIQRVACLRDWLPDLNLPIIDRDCLENIVWDLCDGKRSLAEVKNAPWLDWLQSRFTPEQVQAVEKEAPSRITVPSGNSIRIEYQENKPPVLAVKIQEVFSWKATPRIARGKVPLLLHLLSPAMRPQQVTDDLASFWANGYPEVKKELKRRYPKHAWPEDPTTATPGKK